MLRATPDFSELNARGIEFRRRLEWHGEHLLAELNACWREQGDILDEQFRRLDQMPAPSAEPESIAGFRDARREGARLLLCQPVSRWEHARPQQRSLAALETYHRALEDLAPAGSPAARAVRRLVGTEDRWLLPLLLCLRMMTRPWEVYRRTIDGLIRGNPSSRFNETQQWAHATLELERIRNAGDAALEALRGALQRLGPRLSPRPSRRPDRVAVLRGVEAELRLSTAVHACTLGILDCLAAALEDIEAERGRLLGDLDAVIDWLQLRQRAEIGRPFPAAGTIVTPASNRIARLENRMENEIAGLPEESLLAGRLRGSLARATSTRRARPRQVARRAIERNLRHQLLAGCEEVQACHQKAVLAIERVRDVVAFAESETAAGAETDALTREALQHSHSLLEFSRGELSSWQHSIEGRLLRGAAEAFAEIHLLLGRDWLSVQAYIADRGLRRCLALARQIATDTLTRLARQALSWAAVAGRGFLQHIGWSKKVEAGQVEVITRAVLPKEFAVDAETIALPALYRRLFRPEPVQDIRFLVGRERETAAIAEARAFWEQGRPAALLIVGARGTGKTSLINCAVTQCFPEVEVVREEFRQRVVTQEALREYLGARLGAGDPDGLEAFLGQRRRVIVLEEAERTFLRHVNHYGAARALQRLIAATCPSVLWIVSLNSAAFHLLDAALQFGSGFSHRVNTGGASRDDLRNAILVRHNLSGLRLEFLSGEEAGASPGRWFTGLAAGVRTAESLFFDALTRESDGIYRSAFDIWLAHMEGVQAGALYLRALSQPDLGPVISEFDQQDLFTLAAVLQHGSLTPEEHATVFQWNPAESRAQIDELAAREILEPDQARGGFRVRPHALRLVREALYRRNLL